MSQRCTSNARRRHRRLLEPHRRARRRIVPRADAARALPQLPGVLRRGRGPARCRCARRAISPTGRRISREPAHAVEAGTRSVVIFRVASEWLALPTVRRHRSRESAAHPFAAAPAERGRPWPGERPRRTAGLCLAPPGRRRPEPPQRRAAGARGTAYRRLLVIRREGVRVVCPVDEVHGIHRFHPRELKEMPDDGRKGHGHLLDGAVAVAGPLRRHAGRPARCSTR